MSYKIVQQVSPNVTYTIPLTQGINTDMAEVWNGTPFDLDYYGLGSLSETIVVAGTGRRFNASDGNAGQIIITPINNNNVSGTGVVNIMVYNRGDVIPPGTFPVAIPTQTVQAKVSSVNTLSDEGRAVGSETIDIGDTNFSKLIDIFNDGHGIWNVDQSNVKHQVLLWSASGNPLVIGQSGDTVPFNGAVTIAQTLGITGVTTATGGVNVNTIRDNVAGNSQIALSNISPQVTINNDEAVSGIIEPNKGASQTTNGSVGGSVSFFTPIWGTGLKILIVQMNNWNSVNPATFIFPSGNIGWGMFFCGPLFTTMNVTLQNGASAQTIKHLTGLGASNTSGNDSAQTAFNGDNIGTFSLPAGCDRIVIGSNTGATSATLVIIGN